ncbi:MAG: hypothetical protein ACO289_10765 [Prochlorococcaceae cyanobacterium]
MEDSAFRIAQTRTVALLADPFCRDPEELTISVSLGWRPYQFSLSKNGGATFRFCDEDCSEVRAVELSVCTDQARDVLASAVVSYVANLGDCYSETYADFASALLDRLAGAMDSTRVALAKSRERIAAKAAATSEA